VLATQLGFRCAEGLGERSVYREFFPSGLTALDQVDTADPVEGAHPAARAELVRLLDALRLPLDARGQRRAAARAEWFAAIARPLEMHDLIER